MNETRNSGWLRTSLCVLLSSASFVGGWYMGSTSPAAQREALRLRYGMYKAAPGFHKDPWNLQYNFHVNQDNLLEVYAVDAVRGRGSPVGEDVYPPTQEMLRKLVENGIISATDVKTYLPDVILQGAALEAGKDLAKRMLR